MTAPIPPGRPDRALAGEDPFARRPGEDDAAYAERLHALEVQLAARQAAVRRFGAAVPRSGARPEGRQAVTTLRSAGPVGRAARAVRDRRAQRDRRIGIADRRAGRLDMRSEAARVERRLRRRDRRVGTRDRRWLPERRRQAGPAQAGAAIGPSATSFVLAALFVLALFALAAVALF